MLLFKDSTNDYGIEAKVLCKRRCSEKRSDSGQKERRPIRKETN